MDRNLGKTRCASYKRQKEGATGCGTPAGWGGRQPLRDQPKQVSSCCTLRRWLSLILAYNFATSPGTGLGAYGSSPCTMHCVRKGHNAARAAAEDGRWKIEDGKDGQPQTGRARSSPRITLITRICLIRVIREIRGGDYVEQREARLLSAARRPRLDCSPRRKESANPDRGVRVRAARPAGPRRTARRCWNWPPPAGWHQG